MTELLENCSIIDLCRHLVFHSDSSSHYFCEIGDELYKRCLQDDLINERAGAAAVWAYCLSEFLIINAALPPELVALRSQRKFDVMTFDFAANLRKCFEKAASGGAARGRSETAAAFWFRGLPASSPFISPSKQSDLTILPSQRSELLKIYSNRYK